MSYTALTVGPIYKTLKKAQKTREIWGASYFFSFLMKEIIVKIKAKNKSIEFVTPFVDEDSNKTALGVGLYHDRLIVKSDSFSKNDLDEIIDEVLKSIDDKSKGKVTYKFLKSYLQLHTVELDEKKVQNPVVDISAYLDTLELNWNIQREAKNRLLLFVKNNLYGSFLAQDAFGSNKTSFESLPEIALSGVDKQLIRQKLKDDELEIYNDEDVKKELQPYHKYIAIVQADGDNMGAVLQEIGSKKEKLSNFSKALFEFCLQATQKVSQFEGKMIFAGGDDLLFFAPVISGKKTIFSLCEELSEIFETQIEKSIEDLHLKKKPSLSFGVSITYYKFPLYEAREKAVELLFDKAKNEPKNNIAFRVTKHSGQAFEAVINKSNKELFLKFLEVTSLDEKMDENFLHSIYTKIYNYKKILHNIQSDRVKLENFFANYFNESEHKRYKDFFANLVALFVLASNEDSIQDKIDFVYVTLRFKKFLLGDK